MGSKGTDRTLRPKLSDFKRRGAGREDVVNELTTEAQNRGSMSRRARSLGEERSLRTRRIDNIFDNFRNNIESIMDPLSSWGYFPSYSRLQMEQGEGVRTPTYDMVDDGDRYKLIVELPGRTIYVLKQWMILSKFLLSSHKKKMNEKRVSYIISVPILLSIVEFQCLKRFFLQK